MSEERESHLGPEAVREVLGHIDEGWGRFLGALQGIPEERLEELGACGDWSAKNLMGHLAFWDEHVLTEIDRAMAGLPEKEVDFQALNDADEAARKQRTLAEERAALHRAHAAVVARLEGVAGSDAARLDRAIGRHTYAHYAAHARDIERWRHQVGL